MKMKTGQDPFLYPPNGLCVLPVLMRNRLEVQIALTGNTVCVPAHTQMHVPVCVYMLQGVRKRNRFCYLRDGDLFQGHLESKEIQGALCSCLGLQEPAVRFTAV